MRRNSFTLSLAVACLAVTPAARSQMPATPWCMLGRAPRGYGGYSFSSTLQEGIQHGFADIVRARGYANLTTSMALINVEEARKRSIDNQRKRMQTLLEMRRAGYAERRASYDRKYERIRKSLASRPRSDPPRLSTEQFDPVTGRIDWPEALLTDDYAAARETIEELFYLRYRTSGNPGLAKQIRDTARRMQDELQSNIRDLLPRQFLSARKFLDGIAYEAGLPTGG